MANKVEILTFSHYCPSCDMRQDTAPGPHIKRCPDYNGIMDTRVEGAAVYLNRAPAAGKKASFNKPVEEVEQKQPGPLSTPAWLENYSRSTI